MRLHETGKAVAGIGLAILFAASNAAYAVTPVGPGEYRVDTDEDISYVESGFSVAANAAITVRPGVFYPEGGPKNVDEVIWRNVKLTDIESFTGRIGHGSGESYNWKDANCYHVVTNETSGYVECQLQIEAESYIHGFVMQYRQDGDDVKARIAKARHAYKTGAQVLGCDLNYVGADSKVTNTLYVATDSVRAIADLGFVLREDAEASAAPTGIVLASTDESSSDEETYRYMPYLMSDNVTLCRNLHICDIVGISGEISFYGISNGKWTPVGGYCLTNMGSYVQCNLVWRGSQRRVGANIRFYQNVSDVEVRAAWAGHSYDDKAADEPFGSGVIGVELGVTNETNTGKIAIRNLKVNFRPTARIVGDFEPCIMKEDGWVKIWPGVNLSDIAFGPALMGGYSANSTWNVVSNYLRTTTTYANQSYYQWYKASNSELYSIRFLMQQQVDDVYAKIASARYTSGKHLGDDPGTGNYQTAVTNTVDGKSSSMNRTVAICHMTADLPARKRHTVTVGDDFDPGFSPIRLDSMKLALAPSANYSLSFGSVVHGCGVIGVSGAGAVTLAADLSGTVGLDVDSGTAVIDASRTVGGLVNVAPGATLKFMLANGSRPALSAMAFSVEPGASVVLSADTIVTDVPDDGETFKLVTGCNYVDYALDGVICGTAGGLAGCTAKLLVDEDGDIAAFLRPKRGLMLLVK